MIEYTGEENYDNSLLYFTAAWCGPCRMLKPVLEKIESESDLEIVRVDTDKFAELAQEYKIMSVPTMILFKDGQSVRTVTGAKPKKVLEAEFLTRSGE